MHMMEKNSATVKQASYAFFIAFVAQKIYIYSKVGL